MLVFFFDRNEAHVGSSNRFADGGCIGSVVLATLAAHAIRGDELGGNEFDDVTIGAELSGPMVRIR